MIAQKHQHGKKKVLAGFDVMAYTFTPGGGGLEPNLA
jgi:hypothetical protein